MSLSPSHVKASCLAIFACLQPDLCLQLIARKIILNFAKKAKFPDETMEIEGTPLSKASEPQPMKIEGAGNTEQIDSSLGINSYGPILEIKSQIGLEPIMRISQSKARHVKKEETSSDEGLKPAATVSKECYDQIVGTRSSEQRFRSSSTDAHERFAGSKEVHPILKGPSKSQKSQIMLSDIVVGSGLRVASPFKIGKSQIGNSSVFGSKEGQKSRLTITPVGSGSAPGTMTKRTSTLPEVHVQVDQATTEFTSKTKSVKPQLMLSGINIGAQSKATVQGGSQEQTGESNFEKSSSITSEERFLAASAQNSNFADYYHKPSPFVSKSGRFLLLDTPCLTLTFDYASICLLVVG